MTGAQLIELYCLCGLSHEFRDTGTRVSLGVTDNTGPLLADCLVAAVVRCVHCGLERQVPAPPERPA
jgi:hypothetical protein